MTRVIIIGAGISGLSVAFRLQLLRPETDITILERNATPGGTIRTENQDGFRLEAGPNGFLDNKPGTRELCEDVGLADQLIQASESSGKNRYLFLGNGLKRLPSDLWSFLSNDILSLRGKIDLLLEPVRKRKADDRDESIDAFVRRRLGKEAAQVLADAMVTGIYAGDPNLLSNRSCFPRLAEWEHDHGSIVRGLFAAAKKRKREAKESGQPVKKRSGKLWSFDNGLTQLISGVTAKLTGKPTTGVAVRQIHRQEETGKPSWSVVAEDGQTRNCDVVVLTCPAYQQAKMVAGMDNDLAEEMAAIPYNRIAVVGLGYRQQDVTVPVDGFGFIAPQSQRRNLLGVQWCSSIYPHRAPAGHVLMRAMCGGWNRPDVATLPDEDIITAMREELQLAMHIEAKPVFTKIIHWQRAIPQYHLGHQDRVKRIENRLMHYPGLFLGGNAYHGVALNDCTSRGQVLAEMIHEYLGKQ